MTKQKRCPTCGGVGECLYLPGTPGCVLPTRKATEVVDLATELGDYTDAEHAPKPRSDELHVPRGRW
jgi:hypothetical protein